MHLTTLVILLIILFSVLALLVSVRVEGSGATFSGWRLPGLDEWTCLPIQMKQ